MQYTKQNQLNSKLLILNVSHNHQTVVPCVLVQKGFLSAAHKLWSLHHNLRLRKLSKLSFFPCRKYGTRQTDCACRRFNDQWSSRKTRPQIVQLFHNRNRPPGVAGRGFLAKGIHHLSGVLIFAPLSPRWLHEEGGNKKSKSSYRGKIHRKRKINANA